MKPSARSRSLPSAPGFTLIELLVAMAILAVIAVLSWRGLDQVMRGRDAIVHALEDERGNVDLLEQLRRDAQNIAVESEIGQPEVQIARGELRLVRHLNLPGLAPRVQVVDYRLEGNSIVRYASAPLARVSDLATALQRVGSDGSFSASAVGGPTMDFAVRVWIPGLGWSDKAADILTAFSQARAQQSAQVAAVRAVTGLEVRILPVSGERPYLRVLALGE